MTARARLKGIVGGLGRASPVWEGVYTSARHVPRAGAEFAGTSWVSGLREDALRLRHALRAGAPVEPPADVAALAATLATIPSSPIRVLDFGGGLATAYLWAAARLRVPLHWTVVDVEAVCAAGRDIFADDPAVAFTAKLDDVRGPLDVVHARSALQYAADWEATLRALARFRAPVLALHKLTAGKNPTFATAQLNVPGTRIPYWFLAEDDVVRVLSNEGYGLVSRAPGTALPSMDGFPATHRVERALDLLFRREAP